MAYFRKRGDKWYYTIDIGRDPVTGKRKQKTAVGGNTKKEAQAAAAAVLHELAKGTHIEETDMLFKDFAQEWLQTYQDTTNVKVSTIRVRQHEIGRLNSIFANTRIKDVTKKMYQTALNKLSKEFAYNTLSGIHSTGRMIFKKAMEFDMIKVDPTQYARIPRPQKTVEEIENTEEVVKYLEKENLAKFLSTAKDHGFDHDYPLFLLLAYSGMRAGELCALKWKDIDFEEHKISITKTYYNPKNNAKKYELLPPKTKRSIRDIEIEPIVIQELEKLRADQRKFKMAMRNRYHDEDFVFVLLTDENPGYPTYIKKIEIRMERLLRIGELNTDLTPHSLRHTHTSLLAEAGVPLEEIMDRLGHQDDDTTKSVYLHVTKTRKKEASKKFGELLRNL